MNRASAMAKLLGAAAETPAAAMMLAGFGLVGAAVRRQRQAQPA